MEKDKIIALLIDAENVSHKYIKPILDELSHDGNPAIKRIYGDWTTPEMTGWKKVLVENSITPFQQFSYTQGKNASDSAMIIDAMDILYAKNVDSFCIVSSDSDFTKLASRLREGGMFVMGMGENKTPTAFKAACDSFKYLEVLAGGELPTAKRVEKKQDVAVRKAVVSKETVSDEIDTIIIPLKDIIRTVKSILDQSAEEDGYMLLSQVGVMLSRMNPDFDARNYGYNKLYKLFDAQKEFELRAVPTQSGSKNILIRIKI